MTRDRSTGAEPATRWLPALVAIGVVALALRLWHLFALRDTPLFTILIGDAGQYDAWARRLAAGDWMGTDVFYQSPLYPYFIGVLYKLFGQDVFLVRVVQSICGAVSCLLLGSATRAFVGPVAGLVAALLLAVYPPAIFFDGLIQKASLDLLLMTALLAVMGRVASSLRWSWVAAAGVVVALLALNRENARVLIVVLAIWIAAGFREVPLRSRLRLVMVFGLGIATVLLLVAWRNYRVGGEWLISTSQSGTNFYIGNRNGASGTYDPLLDRRGNVTFERDDATRLAEEGAGRRLSAGEVSRYWWRKSFDEIRDNPAGWLRLIGLKALMTVNTVEAVDTESIEAHADFSPVLAGLRWLTFGVILPVAVFGVWVTRRDWRRLSVLYAMWIALAAAVAVFFVFARYRMPLVPIVLMFASAGLHYVGRTKFWSADNWRTSNRSALRTLVTPGVALVTVVAVIVNVPIRVSTDSTWIGIGLGLSERGRFAEAVPFLRHAVEVEPRHADSHFHLGAALCRLGHGEEAAVEFREAVRLAPGVTHFALNSGDCLVKAGLVDAGIEQYRDGLAHVRDLATDGLPLLERMAQAYALSGRWAPAIVAMEAVRDQAKAAGDDARVAELDRQIALWKEKLTAAR